MQAIISFSRRILLGDDDLTESDCSLKIEYRLCKRAFCEILAGLNFFNLNSSVHLVGLRNAVYNIRGLTFCLVDFEMR